MTIAPVPITVVKLTLPVPSNVIPLASTSPVSWNVLPVARAVAVAALPVALPAEPETLPVTLPVRLPVKVPAIAPVPPESDRIKTFEFDYDSQVIEKLQARVIECREYINTLIK